MSLALRTALRARTSARGYATHAAPEIYKSEIATGAKSPFLEELAKVEHHGAETGDLWRKISYYACLPAIAVISAWVYNLETKHFAHIEHVRHENDGVLPQPPQYEYLNRRVKPFPWGNNTLFYNGEIQRNMEEEA